MRAPAWLTRSDADLPAGESWLSERERAVLGGLRFPKRRNDWLLGRWAAKCAIAVRAGAPFTRIEVIGSAGGAPHVLIDGQHAPVSLSISHRGGRALALVGDAGTAIGCDLEVIEPRSGAFVREWLAPAEQPLVRAAPEPALTANLMWTAKEAAAKTRGEGLRLNVRGAVVRIGEGRGEWAPVEVTWDDGTRTRGWWRRDGGWVMSVTGDPAPGAPEPL